MNKLFLTPELERKYLSSGYSYVVGVDEVGRGCWAGPLAVAAFVFDRNIEVLDGVNDSKKLTRGRRETLNQKLKSSISRVELGNINEIDEYNIVEATRRAMVRAVEKLDIKNFFVLVDGYFKKGFDFDFECIKKGDTKHYSIAAASIIAKVYRDSLMRNYAKEYPEYGFETNVGYGTRKHYEALQKFGVCNLHRKTFSPMKFMN